MSAIALFAVIVSLQFPATAEVNNQVRPFPFLYQGTDASELTPIVKELAALETLDHVRLSGVALPRAGGKKDILTLDLRRVRINTNDGQVAVNGVITNRTLEMDTTMWAGKVEGAPESDVYLAFSRYGSRGWISLASGRFELMAGPDSNGDWENARSYLISASELISPAGVVQPLCATPGPATPRVPSLGIGTSGTTSPISSMASSSAPPAFFECTYAIETDWQYYLKFGNLIAAQAYTDSLLGAVASRYLQQVNLKITIKYVGYWTIAGDPWTTPESPTGTTSKLLDEFKDKWGPSPVTIPLSILPAGAAGADLYHFLDGASLGGGIASFSNLCSVPTNDPSNFGISSNMTGLLTFPPVQGPLSWDFNVIAHETGHNFNAIHTHDYCPPLDSCAAPPFGTCQTSQICSTQGTIMSYCHTCAGGMSNITLYYHPQSVADMRDYLMSTCVGVPAGTPALEPFANLPIGGVPHEDLRLARFVDLDSTAGIKDFDCGTLTTNGCTETEIQLIGFAQQDIGVPVFAVSDGVVLETGNGDADLNAPGGGGCSPPYDGNYVSISHGNGISTFYGSLKNGSVSVTIGQRVRSGQQIGLAGSSGCSTWPRVSFEAKGPGGFFDANSGTCNIPTVNWTNNIGKPATTSLNAFLITKDNPPTIFPPNQTPATGQIAASTTKLNYITMFSYLPASSSIRHRLLRPNGTVYLDSTGSIGNPTALYNPWYSWGWTFGGPLSITGTWTLKLDINGTTVVTAPIDVVTTVIPTLNRAPNPITVAFSPAAPKVTDTITCRVTSAVVANDLDYDIVRYRYRWLVNGAEVRNVVSAGRADVLAHHIALDGQTVSCEVTPNDGKIDGTMTSASVAIAPTLNAVAYDSLIPIEKNSGVLTTVSSISSASGLAVLNLRGGIPFEQFSFGFSSNIPFTFPMSGILPGNPGSFVIDIASSSFTNSPFDIFGPGGRAALSVPFIPNPVLIGQQFQLQWMAYDPNIFQIVLSHGLLITIIP